MAQVRRMTRIEVFADIVCPFTHVGLRRLSEERHTRQRSRHAPRTGVAARVDQRRAARPGPRRPGDRSLTLEVAPELFAGFDRSLFPLTSIPAFGLVTASYAVDDATGAAMSMALRDALFEHGADIADDEVLSDLAREVRVEPLGPEAARSGRACRLGSSAGRAR